MTKYITKFENIKNKKIEKIHTLKDNNKLFYTRYSIISSII